MAMMITRFNKLLSSKIVWILFMGIVVVMFALSGIGQKGADISDLWDSRRAQTVVATSEGKDITAAQRNEARNMIRLASQMNRQPVPDDLDKAAYNRIVRLRAAEANGITVHKKEAIATIQSMPDFKNPTTGVFDAAFMSDIVERALGVPTDQFIAYINQELILGRALEVAAAGTLVSDFDTKRVFSQFRDQMILDYVTLTTSAVTNKVNLTEADHKAFYEENKDQFLTDPERQVLYVTFDVSAHTNGVVISEADIEQHYVENVDQYTKEIEVLRDPPKDWYQPRLVTLPPRLPAPPLSPYGAIHTIGQIVQPPPAPVPTMEMVSTNMTLAEASAQIATDLIQEKALKTTKDIAEEFGANLSPNRKNENPKFEEIVKEAGATASTSSFFSVSSALPEFNSDLQINKAAFEITNDKYERASIPVLSSNTFFVLYYHAEREPFVPPFEDIKEDVAKSARQTKLREALADYGEELSKQLAAEVAAGTAFTNAVTKLDLSFDSTELSRLYTEPGTRPNFLTQALLREASTYQEGQVTEPIDGILGTMIGFVRERRPAPLTELGQFRNDIQQSEAGRLRQLHATDYLAYLNRPGSFEEIVKDSEDEDESTEETEEAAESNESAEENG